MMAKYLIDANLPYYFGLWNNSDYIHVKDLDDSWSDEQIWDYAKQYNLIISEKDKYIILPHNHIVHNSFSMCSM